MTYAFLDDDMKEGKRALKIAKKYGNYKNYYIRYKLGNLAILDGSTPPPKNVMDANGKHGIVGVILGDEPRYVTFPNQELLSHFMKRTRHNPGIIKLEDGDSNNQEDFALRTRMSMTLLLATGNNNFLRNNDFQSSTLLNTFQRYNINPHEPSWTDEDGTLTIIFYRMRGNGMMAPVPTQCTVLIDKDDHASYTCSDIDDLAPSMPE